jgi:DNA invertase Pin-like site-specific DNA recombinase
MANADVSVAKLSISTSKGSRIRLNSSMKNVFSVDKILSYCPMKTAYQVLFTDGSKQWIVRRNINSVLTTEFDTHEYVDSANQNRDVSQGYAFLYLRTSKGQVESRCGSTEDSTSIEVQKTELTNFVKFENLKLQGIGMDMGRSAKDMTNLWGLEFLVDQILDFVENEELDGPVYLYIWNVSRFSRNTNQAVELLNKLSEAGVTVFFKEEGVTYSTAAGRHAVRTGLSAAQLHSEGTSELVKKVIQLKKSKGELKTRNGFFVPYGKTRTETGLIDNDKELETISTAIKLFSKTKNAAKVVKLLAAKGLRLRGKRITEAMIKSFSS